MRYEVICYPRFYAIYDHGDKKDVKHARSREAAWKECNKRNREWEKEKSKDGQAGKHQRLSVRNAIAI